MYNSNNSGTGNCGGVNGKPSGGSSGGGGGIRGIVKPSKKNLGGGFGNGGIVQPVFKNNSNCKKHAHMYSSSSVGVVRYNGLFDTIMTVAKEEGPMALMRGSVVRMLAHAPALGVSWTAYELCKKFVMEKFEF